MKVLFINSIKMFGGGEVWLMTMMRTLQERHHQVALVCRPGVPLEERAKSEGFSVFPVTMRGDFDPLSIYRLWRCIRRYSPHVVCTNMDKELRLGGLAAKMAGIPAVIPRRGIDYPLKNTWAYRLSYNHLATGIIANSKATKKALLRNSPWLSQEKIRVIYNGVNPSLFDSDAVKNLRREWRVSRDTFLIGFVGQLDKRKGVDTLVTAFASLSHEYQKTVLVLVGEGAMEENLRSQIEKIKGRVILTGHRSDIPDVMKSIDVLVLPSLWEGFGIVLIEAMAARKPVISTETSNIPEIVTHGINGYLIQPHDSVMLKHYLEKLMLNKPLSRKLGQSGHEMVLEKFTLKQMVSETEKYFLSQLSSERS
jgi:glycosyltransferase involved in cell wall biosynthesis